MAHYDPKKDCHACHGAGTQTFLDPDPTHGVDIGGRYRAHHLPVTEDCGQCDGTGKRSVYLARWAKQDAR